METAPLAYTAPPAEYHLEPMASQPSIRPFSRVKLPVPPTYTAPP